MSDLHKNEPQRLALANLPTPVVELPNLAKHLEIPRILIKRDDLTGIELSGNKIRKLEYLLADAKSKGCDAIVTYGGYQSNHCRATAAVGAKLGMKVRLILRAPQWEPANEGNLFLDRIFGAEISLHPADEYAARIKQLADEAMTKLRTDGHKPYYFPVGASVPLGCWGYIRCVHELISQLGRQTNVDLFVPVSSSGTFAGVILGAAVFELENWRIIGVPVSDSIEYFQKDVRALERATNDQFSLGLKESDVPLNLLDGFIGDGYALPYPESLETTRLLATTEGILLDPTYTSKGMTGMLDCIRRGNIRPDALPVFLHTGGVFGLFARRDLFPPT
jgi:D-cysteine desulfhydrase